MKTAVILPTAFIPSLTKGLEGERRVKQYIDGFIRTAELGHQFPDFDFFWADNTIQPNAQFDQRMFEALRKIPNLKKEYAFYENEYGKLNKGCGILAVWEKVLPDIVAAGYENVIHFEPRQEIINFSFFETFATKPGTYFKEMHPRIKKWKIFSTIIHQVWLGLFSCSPRELLAYTRSQNMATFAKRNTVIETSVYSYLHEHNIAYTNLESVGLRWHDSARNRHVLI